MSLLLLTAELHQRCGPQSRDPPPFFYAPSVRLYVRTKPFYALPCVTVSIWCRTSPRYPSSSSPGPESELLLLLCCRGTVTTPPASLSISAPRPLVADSPHCCREDRDPSLLPAVSASRGAPNPLFSSLHPSSVRRKYQVSHSDAALQQNQPATDTPAAPNVDSLLINIKMCW